VSKTQQENSHEMSIARIELNDQSKMPPAFSVGNADSPRTATQVG
jgi:hypothetical protein